MRNEMRNRLIELIVNEDTYDPYECYFCTKDDDYCDCCYAEKLADHLIANGVTVQKWISVKDRLPEKEGEVLVCDTREDFISTWEYLGKGLWLYDDIFWGTDDITHWMPLPQPPKGEQT